MKSKDSALPWNNRPPYADISAHTPLPFHVGTIAGRIMAVYGPAGEQVADCSSITLPDEENRQNAAYIVTACNSHPANLARIEELERHCKQLIGHWDAVIASEGSEFSNGEFDHVKDSLEDARAFLEGSK